MKKFALLIVLVMLIAPVGVPSDVLDAAPPAQTPDCSTFTLPDGLGAPVNVEMMFDGRTRHYRLFVPAGYDPQTPTPLVLNFHGFASNPPQQAAFSDLEDVATAETFIAVHPSGTGFPLRWNSGASFFEMGSGVDDVGFVRALVETLSAELCIDPARVYATGMSNGGGMSNRLACEAGDLIAAFGGVAGAYALETGCAPSRPVPFIAFHGTADPLVPYEGGTMQGMITPDIETWARDWAERDGCDLTPETFAPEDGVSGTRYTGCAGDVEVVLYTIDNGGHTWPGGPPLLSALLGETHPIDATAITWAFFERFTLP